MQPPPRPRTSALHWIGLGLFLAPFAMVPLAMLGVVGGAGAGASGAALGVAGIGLVPCSFAVAIAGLVLMVVAGVRARRSRDRARHDRGGGPSFDAPRRRGAMRGDRPDESDVDYPAEVSRPRPASRREPLHPDTGDLGGPTIATRDAVRCGHCGVFSAPGAAACGRCGAVL